MSDLSAKSLLLVTHKRSTFTHPSNHSARLKGLTRLSYSHYFLRKINLLHVQYLSPSSLVTLDNCWKCHLYSESVRDIRNLKKLACLSQATINLWLWVKISLLLLAYTASKRWTRSRTELLTHKIGRACNAVFVCAWRAGKKQQTNLWH